MARHDVQDSGEQGRSRGRLRWFLIGIGIGAVAQYFADPERGRARRVKTRDMAAARVRRPVRQAEDLARMQTTMLRDRAEGLAHEATTSEADRVPDDDRALANKVRSEALGGDEWRPDTINVDAVDGVVTLRGELDSRERIERAERAVSEVPGVRRVDSFLHLPGEPAPNVEDGAQSRSR